MSFFSFCRTGPANASTRLAEVYAELEVMESDKAPSRASVILAGLGFTPAMQVGDAEVKIGSFFNKSYSMAFHKL